MQKALLLSLLVCTVAIPARMATDSVGRRGLFRTVFFMVLFNLFYTFSLVYIVPKYTEVPKADDSP